jgi:hypothetical protein
MTMLDAPLLALSLDEVAKETIRAAFWGPNCQSHKVGPARIDLQSYWLHYQKRCHHTLHGYSCGLDAKTHGDIVEIARLLRRGMHRDDITSKLQGISTEERCSPDSLGASIDLTASLLLMTDFGTLDNAFSGRTQLTWTIGSLAQAVQAHFSEPPALSLEKVKLEKRFNIESLRRIARIEIVWTDNLADHLRLTNDDTRVHIFHHASFLRCQNEGFVYPNIRRRQS